MKKRQVQYEYTMSSGRIGHGIADLPKHNLGQSMRDLASQNENDPHFRFRPGRYFDESVWFYENMPENPAKKMAYPNGLNKTSTPKKPVSKVQWIVEPNTLK